MTENFFVPTNATHHMPSGSHEQDVIVIDHDPEYNNSPSFQPHKQIQPNNHFGLVKERFNETSAVTQAPAGLSVFKERRQHMYNNDNNRSSLQHQNEQHPLFLQQQTQLHFESQHHYLQQHSLNYHQQLPNQYDLSYQGYKDFNQIKIQHPYGKFPNNHYSQTLHENHSYSHHQPGYQTSQNLQYHYRLLATARCNRAMANVPSRLLISQGRPKFTYSTFQSHSMSISTKSLTSLTTRAFPPPPLQRNFSSNSTSPFSSIPIKNHSTHRTSNEPLLSPTSVQNVVSLEREGTHVNVIDAIQFMLKYEPKDTRRLLFTEVEDHDKLWEIISNFSDEPQVASCHAIHFENKFYAAVEMFHKDYEFAKIFQLKLATQMPFNFKTNTFFVKVPSSSFVQKISRNKQKYLDPIFGIYGKFSVTCDGNNLVLKGDDCFRLGLYNKRKTYHKLAKLYIKIDLVHEISTTVNLSDDEDGILSDDSEEFKVIQPHTQIVDSNYVNLIEGDKENEVLSSQKREMERFKNTKNLLFNDSIEGPNKKQKTLSLIEQTKLRKSKMAEDENSKSCKYIPSTNSLCSTNSSPKLVSRVKKYKKEESREKEIRSLIDIENSMKQRVILRTRDSSSSPIQIDMTFDTSEDDDLELIESSSEEKKLERSPRMRLQSTIPKAFMPSKRLKPYTYFEGDHLFTLKDIPSNYLIIRHIERNDYDLEEFIAAIQERIAESGSSLLRAAYSSKYKHIALKLSDKTSVITALAKVHGHQYQKGNTINLTMCDEFIGKQVFAESDEAIDLHNC